MTTYDNDRTVFDMAHNLHLAVVTNREITSSALSLAIMELLQNVLTRYTSHRIKTFIIENARYPFIAMKAEKNLTSLLRPQLWFHQAYCVLLSNVCQISHHWPSGNSDLCLKKAIMFC